MDAVLFKLHLKIQTHELLKPYIINKRHKLTYMHMKCSLQWKIWRIWLVSTIDKLQNLLFLTNRVYI